MAQSNESFLYQRYKQNLMRHATQWYVYELVDPRDGQTFYIGKGKGSRCHEHEREALKGVCSEKCQRIRDVIDSGLRIVINKVAEFWDEEAAYECEAERIAEGWDYLTNVMPGGMGGRSGERDRPYVEPTPAQALKLLNRRIDLVAHYLVVTDGGRKKVKVSVDGLHEVWSKVMSSAMTAMYNSLFAHMINIVKRSPSEWDALNDYLLPYGVRLENGCQN